MTWTHDSNLRLFDCPRRDRPVPSRVFHFPKESLIWSFRVSAVCRGGCQQHYGYAPSLNSFIPLGTVFHLGLELWISTALGAVFLDGQLYPVRGAISFLFFFFLGAH